MTALDTEIARSNMIEQQIRPCEVIDERVLQAFREVPREKFVGDAYLGLAFADIHVPLKQDDVMMKPLQEGIMLQALEVQPGERVLEIGTGSGFVTACLLHLGGDVTSYEIDPDLSAAAAENLANAGYTGAALRVGDVFDTAFEPRGYKVIAVTGSLPVNTEALENLLAPGGRMFAVIGEQPVMHATLITRSEQGELHREAICETLLPALQNAPQPEKFSF